MTVTIGLAAKGTVVAAEPIASGEPAVASTKDAASVGTTRSARAVPIASVAPYVWRAAIVNYQEIYAQHHQCTFTE
jgi:hypothetical protein